LPSARLPAALRNATWLLAGVAACAHGGPTGDQPDAAAVDASHHPDGAIDAAIDAAVVAPDVPVGCAISAGMTPVLDGVADLADYPAAQHLALGAMLGSDDAAIAWDTGHLYVSVTSDAFTGAFEPLHLYVEASESLGPAVPAPGKEYNSLTPVVPFTPTHLIGVRRVTDAGTGPYDSVFTPAGSWTTRLVALVPGTDVFASSDQRTLSVQVPWSVLGGCPTALRLALHVVHGVSANEWKDVIPTTHTPWQSPGGGYYEIDLTGAPAVAGWALR